MSRGILVLKLLLVNLSIDFSGNYFYTLPMTSPDKYPSRARYPDRLAPPPSGREWASWLLPTFAYLGLVCGVFISAPTPEELKVLTSYTPTRVTTPTRTPTPYPTGITLTVYRGTPTPTPDPIRYNTPVPQDRAFPGY